MRSIDMEKFLNQQVEIKLRGMRDVIKGALKAIDTGRHGALGNLIVQDGENNTTIIRGNRVVSVALTDCPCDTCKVTTMALCEIGDELLICEAV